MYYTADINCLFYRVEGWDVKIIRVLSSRQDFIQLLFHVL